MHSYSGSYQTTVNLPINAEILKAYVKKKKLLVKSFEIVYKWEYEFSRWWLLP